MRKQATMLLPNYITSRLQGRTGNMMFQIAHGYVKALEYDRQFVVPSQESSSGHLEKTLFRKLDFNITHIPSPELSQHIWAPFTYADLQPVSDRPTVFAGWYQSEKFFGKYKQAVRDLYSPTMQFVDRALRDFPFLSNSTVGAINVRRGDYLTQPTRHPVVTTEYINEAVKHLPHCEKILVLSDDIQWCRDNIKLDNAVFVDNYVDCEGLWLLSLCDHFVISNSTFSWWGAYLSNSTNKTVVAPDTWFGPDIHEDTRDLYCDGWIKIPTEWRDGFLYLKK